jgi:hypothetical protein
VEVLAHGSGIDELAIFLFPVFFGGGLWLLTRKRRSQDDDEPVLGSAIGGASETAPPPAGATRLHLLMGGQQPEPDSEPNDTNDAQPA